MYVNPYMCMYVCIYVYIHNMYTHTPSKEPIEYLKGNTCTRLAFLISGNCDTLTRSSPTVDCTHNRRRQLESRVSSLCIYALRVLHLTQHLSTEISWPLDCTRKTHHQYIRLYTYIHTHHRYIPLQTSVHQKTFECNASAIHTFTYIHTYVSSIYV